MLSDYGSGNIDQSYNANSKPRNAAASSELLESNKNSHHHNSPLQSGERSDGKRNMLANPIKTED